MTTRVSSAAAADLVGCSANTIEQQIEEIVYRRPRRCDRGLTSTWSMPEESTGSAQGALRAAGLSQSFPQGAPSGIPSNLPSGAPTNLPSGSPSNFPSNFPGGPGSPGGQLNNPKVQAALKACGIQVPNPTAAGGGGG